MQTDHPTERLPMWFSGLGWLMRRMPRGPRKLEYWWWLLFQRIGAGRHFDDPGERDWPKSREFTVRGRHGVVMITDLAHWANRWHYFRGSYYQDAIVFLLENLARRGDIIVDAGANLGMVTCLAGRLTGPSGFVHAFEPNPDLIGRLREHIKLNDLQNVTIHNVDNVGLADSPGPCEVWSMRPA